MSKKNKSKKNLVKSRIYTQKEVKEMTKSNPDTYTTNSGIVTTKNFTVFGPSLHGSSISESICDKARRLADERNVKRNIEQAQRELAFLRSLFGEKLEEVKIYQNESGVTYYRICGRDWYYNRFNDLDCLTGNGNYKGIDFGYERALTLEDFGQALINLDKEEERLRKKYPDTWWDNLKIKWHLFLVNNVAKWF